MSQEPEVNRIDPIHSTLQLGIAHDLATGDVYLVIEGRSVAPLGNTRSGAIYLTRVYAPEEGSDSPAIPLKHAVGWTVEKEASEGERPSFTPEQMAYQALMFNFNLRGPFSDLKLQGGNLLAALEEHAVPYIVERKLTGLQLLHRSADTLMAWRQGRASVSELSGMLEILTAFVSLIPQEFLDLEPVLEDTKSSIILQ